MCIVYWKLKVIVQLIVEGAQGVSPFGVPPSGGLAQSKRAFLFNHVFATTESSQRIHCPGKHGPSASLRSDLA
jgi:hypothetical protein